MRAVRQFTVVPAIPDELAPLAGLAANLHWTWDSSTVALFRRLDPTLWKTTGSDPLHLLAAISASRWKELATDAEIVDAVHDAAHRLAAALESPRWFHERTASPLGLVAYFSPEFGISETVPQYSGGLGVLAGDHLKAASDLGVPLVGVGILYAEGYFRQRLNADGMQEERYPRLEPSHLAARPTGVQVVVDLAGDPTRANVWQLDVGRIRLFLLDTAVEGNSPEAAAVTDRLYGGDREHRLRQEILLGIGGVRALRALGLDPQVFHTNEGHAGFLSFERIRELVAGGLSFDAAVEAVRAGGVFTTHTPVAAGIDVFPREMIERYFTSFAATCGTSIGRLLTLGSRPGDGTGETPGDNEFNMAVLGLRMSARSNGVAQLHGAVSREMFADLWPDTPVDEVPIDAITNGVHAHTWVGEHVEPLLARSVGPVWDGADDASWAGVHTLDPAEIWAARSRGRADLVGFVRARLGGSALDPRILTIGFARRFATYKRATLLLSQPERLRALLLSSDRPVQFVFAGKAHPADQPGKDMIRDIELFARRLDVDHRFVFLPDYDMAVARMMYRGTDVWLNNPRRPLEACGTSGMKTALNGCLNCSVLDGWWDECFDGHNGWAIASAEDDPDLARRDHREATNLFGLLEREIVPLFYERDDAGVPVGWTERIAHNWATLGPFVTASRMVRDYTTRLYEPAAADARRALERDASHARDLAAWKARVRAEWDTVRINGVSTDTDPAHEGDQRSVHATIELGALGIADVRVQVLHGPIDSEGGFVGRPAIVDLDPDHGDGGWSADFMTGEAGPYGLTVRVIPSHPMLASPVELGLAVWAG
ncbi:MAG: alpha-glucan family phosphorylase [Ilumatobacteraceae bacterium]